MKDEPNQAQIAQEFGCAPSFVSRVLTGVIPLVRPGEEEETGKHYAEL